MQVDAAQGDPTSRSSANVGSLNDDGRFITRGGVPLMWPDFLTGQPEQPVRVLLIDDDAHMRRVISQELLGDLRINLVGQASSMKEGRRLISQHEFDVMLVDLNLGDGTGFHLIESMNTQGRDKAPNKRQEKDTLSEREKEVLKLVASGYTSVEIGMRLCISAQTVNTHIKNIYAKLQVRTRAQAVSFAVLRGLF